MEPPAKQVLYVFGDPRNAAISVFQRRESRHERHGVAATPSIRRASPAPHFAADHARNLGVESGVLNEDWGLADFVAAGHDAFGFEEHLAAWLAAHVEYPILFVRYETFWRRMHEVAKRLGIERPDVAFVRRRADWRAEPQDIQDGLNQIYGRYCEWLAKVPDVFLLADLPRELRPQ